MGDWLGSGLGKVDAVRRGRGRHCFAVHGDLQKLDADVYVIPTDSYGAIESHWSWATGTEPDGSAVQLRIEAEALREHGWAWVPSAQGSRTLALNVAGSEFPTDLKGMLHRFANALQELDTTQLDTRFRARPLVAMPLIGLGGAGMGGRTGEVITALLTSIDRHFETHPSGVFDLAIVTRERSCIAALQHERRRRQPTTRETTPTWLSNLVTSGRRGELAVMFGAGVSAALGLPMWNELLETLVKSLEDSTLNGMDLSGLDPTDAATLLIETGGSEWFSKALSEALATARHSLAHGLIANLGCPLVITTNYDQAFEIAAGAITAAPVTVLPWDEDTPRGPRILKLHGDLTRGQLVLSRDQFVAMHAFRRPLAGVLQSRMLIGRVLAVGTSMSDATLVHAAEEFRALMHQANAEGATRAQDNAGTIILTGGDPARARLLSRSFNVVNGDGSRGIREAARDVDILLDWLAMQVSNDLSFTLDPRFSSMLNDTDKELAGALCVLARKSTPRQAPVTELRQSLSRYLESLGAQEGEA